MSTEPKYMFYDMGWATDQTEGIICTQALMDSTIEVLRGTHHFPEHLLTYKRMDLHNEWLTDKNTWFFEDNADAS